MCQKTAKAAVMVGVDKPFEVREFPVTAAPAGMAKMSLIASGICGTDIHIHRGKIPLNTPSIIGHEFVGKIEEIGDADAKNSGLKVGDRVIVDIACPCGECELCRNGDDANCVNLGVTNGGDIHVAPYLYGGYTEVNYTPVKNLIRIPDELDPTMVCVYACAGPTALHAFRLAKQANCGIEKANVAVVQGLGPVGTFAVAYLASLGIKHVVAITAGNNAEREALALKLGATEVCNVERTPVEEIIEHVRQLNGGLGVDVVFEASGSPKAVPQGMQMLRNRGVYLVPGQYSNSGGVEIQPQMITFNALQIIGSSQYSVSDVENYLAFIQANPQLHECIRALASIYPVEKINEALEDAKSGKNIKTMLAKCE
ncbi:MAG: alcohol dehydrogenase catalytic domain-containing protein [Clostridia bacterium]|nr:alcohol dehydrogenase catalytic domain-containing protein [Clostridia bacterium]